MNGKVVLVSVLLLAVAVRFALEQKDTVVPVTCTSFPGLCGPTNTEGKAPITNNTGAFEYGRWKMPSTNLDPIRNIATFMDKMNRLKTWSYMSVVSPKYFIAITPVQFHYVEDVYISVVDREQERQIAVYHWQLPLGRSVTIAPAGTVGCTYFQPYWGSTNAEICFDPDTDSWNFKLNMTELSADLRVRKGKEALALLYPLGGDTERPAYVHKEAGMEATGTVRVSGQAPYTFSRGAGALDWTLTHALKDTYWRWVSMNCEACEVTSTKDNTKTEEHVGINLSTLVYDITNQESGKVTASSENMLWIGHKVFPLNVVMGIEPTGDLGTDNWRVTGKGVGCEVDLTFQPHGTRSDHTGPEMRLVGVISDFVQPFGKFNGQITVADPADNSVKYKVRIVDCYGVCEDHHSLW
eukprot:TRINITY_DN67786_c6_g3_i1.p1 TRINITY_DN67786_c6_g3~~TRINITY_DN67786_c6_g3_i1.p1  ORF type:complete len:410 (-),score=5.69 TRINITY_DN67786_c6_g3_i1:93-1322(-)